MKIRLKMKIYQTIFLNGNDYRKYKCQKQCGY